MPEPVFIVFFLFVLVGTFVSIGILNETQGKSIIFLLVMLPLSVPMFIWWRAYANTPFDYLPPRYVEIEKRGDQYLAIDIERNEVYNVLSMIGRVPKDNEVVELKKIDTSKLYCGVWATRDGEEKRVVEKKIKKEGAQ